MTGDYRMLVRQDPHQRAERLLDVCSLTQGVQDRQELMSMWDHQDPEAFEIRVPSWNVPFPRTLNQPVADLKFVLEPDRWILVTGG